MGMLVNGEWVADPAKRSNEKGRFEREQSHFRDWVSADGATGFKAEPGRYHLYVAHSCPWAHRTVITRALKGLEDAIGLSIVQAAMGEEGWSFGDEPGAIPDTVNGCALLREVYLLADPTCTGRVTVPVLWDKEKRTIVNNESPEVMRMLNDAFDEIGDANVDLYPEALSADIDAVNAVVYETVNEGVYKCAFAATQAAYEEAFDALFGTLDELDARLGGQRYLVGDRLTEADWRLFVTLIRFDLVYYSLMKCNRQRIADYPHLANYTRELYQIPGVAETIDFDHIKKGYWGSMRRLNPLGIIPRGPEIDFSAPHDRGRLPAAA